MLDPRPYQPNEIELRWQQRWKREFQFQTPPKESNRADRYVYAAPPFTTGNLHLGHVRSYTLADAFARYSRAQGASVLFSMGFDSFGLPNEMAAMQHQMPPRQWVEHCMRNMTIQFERLGCSFDWSRAYDSSHEDLFRWSQWAFLKFLEHDLVYKAQGMERWCDECETVLAALQVKGNKCWRCEQETRFVQVSQWYLRLRAFAKQLDDSTDELVGWDPTILKEQRALLGRYEGFEIHLHTNDGARLPTFIADPQLVSRACFVAISPKHPLLRTPHIQSRFADNLVSSQRTHWNRQDRSAASMPLIDTGLTVGLPGESPRLPLIASPHIDQRFGGGAAFGIPDTDRSDRSIANRLDCTNPWKQSVASHEIRNVVRYRCQDFSISRKRFWGAPIPIIDCHQCGTVPISENDLPVRLPDEIVFSDQNHQLVQNPELVNCECPKCGSSARRETDTLDSHMDALWHIVPPCVAISERKTNILLHPELQRWLPASQIICGSDQAKYMLSYRFFFQAMAKCGVFKNSSRCIPADNLLMHGMVLANNKKMSKHQGNVIAPDDLIQEVGVDTVRFWVLDAASAKKDFNWTPDGIDQSRRFVDAFWEFVMQRIELMQRHSPSADAIDDKNSVARSKLKKWHHVACTKIHTNYERLQFHLVTQNLKLLLKHLNQFESLISQREPNTTSTDSTDAHAIAVVIKTILRFLEPITPHLAEELWQMCGGKTPLDEVKWPKDGCFRTHDEVEM